MRPLVALLVPFLLFSARSASAGDSPAPEQGEVAPPEKSSASDGGGAPRVPGAGRGGFFLGVGVSMVVPAGQYEAGSKIRSFDVGLGGTLLLGVFFNHRIGLLAGGRISGKHVGKFECPSDFKEADLCGGSSAQVPILLQLAFKDRREGPYVQAGPALFPSYSSYASYADKIEMKASGLMDFKVGVGYRATQSNLFGLEFFANMDVGKFSKYSSKYGGQQTSGEISRKAIHYFFETGLMLHWAP